MTPSARPRALAATLAALLSLSFPGCATLEQQLDQQPPEVQIALMGGAAGATALVVGGLLAWSFLDTSSAGDTDEPEEKVRPLLGEGKCAEAVEATNGFDLPTMKGLTTRSKTRFGTFVEWVHLACYKMAERRAFDDAPREELVAAVAILEAAGGLKTGDLELEDREAGGFSSGYVSVSAARREALKADIADRIAAIDAEEERKRKAAEEEARRKREVAQQTIAFATEAERSGHMVAAFAAYASLQHVDEEQKALRETKLDALAPKVRAARTVPVALSSKSAVPPEVQRAVAQELSGRAGAFKLVSEPDAAVIATFHADKLTISRSEENVRLSHTYPSGTQEVPNPAHAKKQRDIADTRKEIESRQKTIARTKCDSRDCTAADRDKLKRSQEKLARLQQELAKTPPTKTVPATAELAYTALSKNVSGQLPLRLVLSFTDNRPAREFNDTARFSASAYTHDGEARVGLKARNERPLSDEAVTNQVHAAAVKMLADTIVFAPSLYAQSLSENIERAKTPAERLEWAVLRWSMTRDKADEKVADEVAARCFPGSLATWVLADRLSGR